jgi:hypothetical protein
MLYFMVRNENDAWDLRPRRLFASLALNPQVRGSIFVLYVVIWVARQTADNPDPIRK